MNDRERLFLAIGGADPALVARSERRRRARWPGYCLAAAACLALVLRLVLPGAPSHSQDPPPVTIPDPPTVTVPDPPDDAGLLQPPDSGLGTLRLMSYIAPSGEEAVDFLIYVNEELFDIREADGLYSVRNKASLPEDFPLCGLDIAHLPDTSPSQARSAAEDAAKERYSDVTSEEPAPTLPGSLYLRAGAGTDWDSEQAELWFVDDGQGGTFVLTSRYFLEAEEGLGMRFRDMASSFRVVSPGGAMPQWMRSLYETTDRLLSALLSNDLASVSDLLAEGAEAEAYGEDVWEHLSIASVDYALDNDRDPSSATVSVKHRLDREEGESYNYLTMELARREGRWLLVWSGIEK